MTTSKLTRRVLVAVCAALAAALVPGAATADHGTDSASGHINESTHTLDFSAKSTGSGTNAHGRARFTFTMFDPNQTFAGEVTCLRVVGATATTPATAVIGVQLTNVPPGSGVQSMLIEAADSGKFSGAPDFYSIALLGTPAPPDGACPPPSFLVPVVDGEVVIHNTLP